MNESARYASTLSLAVLLLFTLTPGCGGSASPPYVASSAKQSATHAARFALAPGVKHVFIADAVLNIVTIFDSDGQTRTLTGFQEPQLLTTDAAGNLYVANTDPENVEVFAPPYHNKPSITIGDPGEWPVDVAVAKHGTVALINVCQANGSRCGAPGSVYFFANARSKSPCAMVSGGKKISRILAAAFDANGTLYVEGTGNATLGAITGECSATTLTPLQPNATIHFAAGLQVDTNGNIAFVDSGAPTQVTSLDVFSPPTPGSKKIKLLSQNPLSDSGTVVSFALTKNGKYFYTAEPHVSLQYNYPGAGSAIAALTPPKFDLIEGVAITPAETP